MKKCLLTVFFAGLVLTCSSQINKGTIYTGVSTSLSFINNTFDNSAGWKELSIGVRGGYFIVNNLAVGPNVEFNKIDDAKSTKLGLFGRYYFFGKLFLGAGFNSVSYGSDSDSQTEIPIELGYAFFVTESVSVEPRLLYTSGDGYEQMGAQVTFAIYFNKD